MSHRRTTAELSPDVAAGMAAEHALLGLLALSSDAASHGYELARHFEPGEALGTVIRLEPGMVYHHLKKVHRLGWVEELPGDSSRPARRRVSLTERGRVELHRWLAEPVAHTREIRLEFLVKLHFALLLDVGLAERLIAEQREICERLIDSLVSQIERESQSPGGKAQALDFGEMVLELRLAQTRAALAWLERIERQALTGLVPLLDQA